jgi:hypothetical protein
MGGGEPIILHVVFLQIRRAYYDPIRYSSHETSESDNKLWGWLLAAARRRLAGCDDGVDSWLAKGSSCKAYLAAPSVPGSGAAAAPEWPPSLVASQQHRSAVALCNDGLLPCTLQSGGSDTKQMAPHPRCCRRTACAPTVAARDGSHRRGDRTDGAAAAAARSHENG